MKKFSILLFILLIAFSNCESDDICLDSTTPYLIIRFYDADDPDTIKSVSSLTVWANEKDSIYTSEALDSITIPLNLNENSTIYKLQSDTEIDQLNITYDRTNVYISRSCGYKTIFENVAVTSTYNWIKDFTLTSTTIENETNAHINIYH
ncbi:DUF6452 family protein [Lutibacter sp.]|uniref:DUF6452 family protein n=1 Tax=Lutibacter sp. TaxID=1925666 RepID=UPI003562341B